MISGINEEGGVPAIPNVVSFNLRERSVRKLIEAAPPLTQESLQDGSNAARWPDPIDSKAFYGPVGEFVRIVEPHTEADSAALLVQFLVAVGNVLGRNVYRTVDAAAHRCNLFAVLVGNTSHGRKGSALAQVKRLLKLLAPEWVDQRMLSGLSSGEGMIWAVRDPIERQEPVKEKGKFTGEYQMVQTDPGIQDKRLLVIESEFASVLKVAARDGSTLSPTIRLAWDSGDLQTMTKNSPAKATGAHISIVGHIARDELLRALDSTEVANGFANRFLWVCVKRSKVLPLGGSLEDSDFGRLVVELRASLDWCASSPRELSFSAAARDAWSTVYGNLSAGRPGLLGAVLGRAEAQVLRLGCLYAALDRSITIERAHLEAALALWEYCEKSAEYVFNDKMGAPDADAILSVLRTNDAGLSRTQIRDLFSRNLSANRIERALASLVENQLAKVDMKPTAGRPAELWRAIDTTETTNTTKESEP